MLFIILGREGKSWNLTTDTNTVYIKDAFNNSTFQRPASDISVISQKHSFKTVLKLFLSFNCDCSDIIRLYFAPELDMGPFFLLNPIPPIPKNPDPIQPIQKLLVLS